MSTGFSIVKWMWRLPIDRFSMNLPVGLLGVTSLLVVIALRSSFFWFVVYSLMIRPLH